MSTANAKRKSKCLTSKTAVSFFAVLFVLVLGPGLLKVSSSQAIAGACTDTSVVAEDACENETLDDYNIALGNCYNLSDAAAQAECVADAQEERDETLELCGDQKDARNEICDDPSLSGPYDPEIDPANFVKDPLKIGDGVAPNPYFPLVPGTTWEYVTKDEDNDVIEAIKTEVLRETKKIMGVNCIVIHDRVWEIDDEGEEILIEDTFDWYAQDLQGNVWYFGEISQEFEDGELVGTEGSWKAGVDYAKAGFIMLADPQPPVIYRQEFALGDAEDMGQVISRDEASVNVPFGTFADDVVKTKDFTPIEPDVYEFKYYAPGVGVVLEEGYELNDDDEWESNGERVELVKMEIADDDDDDPVRKFVSRFYKHCLNREPDQKGQNGWVDDLKTKTKTGAHVARGFIFSEEFTKRNTSNEDYLEILYKAFFDRDADADGWSAWLKAIAEGKTRDQILDGFLFSEEFKNLANTFGIKAN